MGIFDLTGTPLDAVCNGAGADLTQAYALDGTLLWTATKTENTSLSGSAVVGMAVVGAW